MLPSANCFSKIDFSFSRIASSTINRLLYFLFLLITTLATINCLCQKDKPDDNFRNASSQWDAKPKKFEAVSLYEFGSYKISATQKFDSTGLLKKERLHRPLVSATDTILYWQNAYRINCSLDSIYSSVNLVVFFWEAETIPGIFSKRTREQTKWIDSLVATISIAGDSLPWTLSTGRFFRGSYGEARMFYEPHVSGKLCRGTEIYSIEHIAEKSIFGTRLKGVIIKNKNGQQLAEARLRGKEYVWLRNDLSPEQTLAIATSLSLILSNKEY